MLTPDISLPALHGITLLSAENLRSGFVWKWFMKNPEVQRAVDLAGLRKTTP